MDPPGAAAVLVHPGAGREAVGQDVDVDVAVGRPPDELDPAALLGAALGPPQVIAVGLDLARARPRPATSRSVVIGDAHAPYAAVLAPD